MWLQYVQTCLCLCVNSNARLQHLHWKSYVCCTDWNNFHGLSPEFVFPSYIWNRKRKKKKKTGLVISMGESFYFWVLLYFQEMQNNKVQHNNCVQRMLLFFKCGFVCIFFHYIIGYLNSKVTSLKVLSQKNSQERGIWISYRKHIFICSSVSSEWMQTLPKTKAEFQIQKYSN